MLKNNAIHPWEQRKFSEVIDFSISNNTLSRAGLNYDNGEIKNIHYGDILVKFDSIIDINDEIIPFITDGKVENFKSQLLQNGDVILADTAEDKTTGKAVEITGISEKYYAVSGLHTMIGRPNIQFAPKFLGYYLNCLSYRKQLLKLMQGIKVFSLSKSSVAKTEISFPKEVTEQQQIGAFFDTLNRTITLHQRKLETLISINTLINHILLPQNKFINPQIRITNFKENWVQRKASELCTISTGKSNTQDRAESGMYPFFIRSESPVRSNKYLYDCEAIITIGDGKIGKVFHYINGKFDLHQRCYMMNNFQNILGKYFYYYFSNNFHRRALTMTAKATVDSVRLEMIADMGIKFPINIEEQKRIIDILDSISKLIYLQKKKIKQYQFLKTYYLKSLFI